MFVMPAEIVSKRHPKDTIKQIDVAMRRIYHNSTSGKGDAFNGNKNCE